MALWMIAALRMLLPAELPSRWSIFALFAHESAANTGERILSRAAGTDAAAMQMQVTAGVDWRMMVWLAGMLVCVLFFLWSWLRSMRRFREAIPMQAEAVADFLNAHPLKRKVRVCCCEAVSTPLTYELLRPVILLPKKADAEGLEMILCHEWMHIRSMDVLKKAIIAAAVCVHWFNPLAWAMLSLSNRDIELACDEQTLRICGDRRAYAMTLIAMEEARGLSEPRVNHFFKNQTEERIVAIMKCRNKSILSIILAVLLVPCSAVAFATTAPENGDLYAEYEPFGLVYDEREDCLYFNGQQIRYFEDLYPVGDSGEIAGIVFNDSNGVVDVHAVRDLSSDIVRNEDGSFDPSGVLTGVEAYSQEEFDARTEEIQNAVDVPYTAERVVIVTSENGEVEYTETHPYENDGPTSVFITGGDGEYSFSLNEDYVSYSEAASVGIIGGADGPTSIYINAEAE